VLKDPASFYRPGERSSAWLKLKPKLTLDVIVTGGSAERIAWGDWGEAVMLELEYAHPRTGERLEIRQAVRIARQQPFELKVGARA
jgi:ATP-dependent DNA ligase